VATRVRTQKPKTRASRRSPKASIKDPRFVAIGKAGRKGGKRDRSEAPEEGVRELTWHHFDQLVHALVQKLGSFKPDLVIGVVKGGLFVGGAVASILRCEFIPVRLAKRSRDRSALLPDVRTTIPDEVKGKRVLVVDDVMQSGETLKRALAEAARSGAREVRSATLVVHSRKAKAKALRPNWFALETDDLVVFPWDYELRGSVSLPGPASDGDPELFGA
jgi:hypoxanthine phosphoribosyltransferase